MGRKKGAHHAPAPCHQPAPFVPTDSYAPQSFRPGDSVPNPPYLAADLWRPQPSNNWPPQPYNQDFSANLPLRSQPRNRQQILQSRETAPNDPASHNTRPWRRSQSKSDLPSRFRPQAPAFEPGQSRYNLRSSQQRPVHTATAERVVQSIETDHVSLQQLPVRTSPRKHTPRREPTPINKSVTPVPVPVPSAAYNKRAQDPPAKVDQPRKLLVLLDLNGTLVYRHGSQRQFSVKRPGVDRLLEYLFANHVVLIFTSATMRSAEKMAQELLTPKQYGTLVTIRAREHLGLKSEQFYNKVQVYKELNKIWSVPEVKQSATEFDTTWNMTNTILIDDSVEKARSHPHNLLQVPEFMHAESSSQQAQQKWAKTETEIMKGVEAKLEELKYCSNVACQIREWQECNRISPGSTSEKVDDNKLHAIKEGVAQAEQPAATTNEEPASYPTPTSLRRGSTLTNESRDDEEDDALQGVKLPNSKETQATSKKGRESVTEKARAVRSPSPITEADFAWRYEGTRNGAGADW